MYEVVMPQLSDSMDEGKLISWKVNVGDSVHAGDTIAEIESDKAVMELQTFKDGVVKELKVQPGDEAQIGSVIALIDTGTSATTDRTTQKPTPEKEEQVLPEPESKPQVEDVPPVKPAEQTESEEIHFNADKPRPKREAKTAQSTSGAAVSPKAKAKAAAHGIDIGAITGTIPKSIIHDEDVDTYLQKKYFTPKALKLLKAYQLSMSLFELNHKIDEKEVQAYIRSHEIPLPLTLTTMQKAIISNVNAAAKRPTFHLYESIDDSLLRQYDAHSMTVWLIKIVAKVMMRHETFRSTLGEGTLSVWPNASISVAVANEKDLYMPVIKDANARLPDEIDALLKTFKNKLHANTFTTTDMEGSTLGISNLGMLGVERFDAMLNKNDAAILAVGASVGGKIALTLTADHSLINGYEAALFMQELKAEVKDPLNYKD